VEGPPVDRLEKENEKDEESERSTVGENRRAIGPTPHVCAAGKNLTLASGAKVKCKLLVGRVHAT
jgi:hypothetical protein